MAKAAIMGHQIVLYKIPFLAVLPHGYNLLDRVNCLQCSSVRHYWSITGKYPGLSKIEHGRWEMKYKARNMRRYRGVYTGGRMCYLLMLYCYIC